MIHSEDRESESFGRRTPILAGRFALPTIPERIFCPASASNTKTRCSRRFRCESRSSAPPFGYDAISNSPPARRIRSIARTHRSSRGDSSHLHTKHESPALEIQKSQLHSTRGQLAVAALSVPQRKHPAAKARAVDGPKSCAFRESARDNAASSRPSARTKIRFREIAPTEIRWPAPASPGTPESASAASFPES